MLSESTRNFSIKQYPLKVEQQKKCKSEKGEGLPCPLSALLTKNIRSNAHEVAETLPGFKRVYSATSLCSPEYLLTYVASHFRFYSQYTLPRANNSISDYKKSFHRDAKPTQSRSINASAREKHSSAGPSADEKQSVKRLQKTR